MCLHPNTSYGHFSFRLCPHAHVFLYSWQQLMFIQFCVVRAFFYSRERKNFLVVAASACSVATLFQAPFLQHLGSSFSSCFPEPLKKSSLFPASPNLTAARVPLWKIITPQHCGTSLCWDSFFLSLSSAAQVMLAVLMLERHQKGFHVNHQDP